MFDVEDLTGVDLHLHLPVRLVLAEPAVAGEHVLFPVDRDGDHNAVQEPTSTQPLVGVANQEAVDLWCIVDGHWLIRLTAPML